MKPIVNSDLVESINIVLNNVSKENSYEGEFTNSALIIHTLDFKVDFSLYTDVQDDGSDSRIKEVIVNYRNLDETIEETVTTTVNPQTAESGDDYTIIETVS